MGPRLKGKKRRKRAGRAVRTILGGQSCWLVSGREDGRLGTLLPYLMFTRYIYLLILLTRILPAQDQKGKSPPAGIALPAKDKAELWAGAKALQAEIDALKQPGALAKGLDAYLVDVEIFAKAVHWAVELDEVFNLKQVTDARNLLKAGNERLKDLKSGKAPWTTATGNVVRGYRSKIDGSVQVYGLSIPEERPAKDGRLDIWLHGRSDVLTELAFIGPQMTKPKTPPVGKVVVLNIYGRFCNAYKFAGEVDVLEAMEDAVRQYQFSRDHIALRGFSMGGAGAWHLGAQYADLWAAVTPGAGFVETAEYAKVDAAGKVPPPDWERKLYALYDVPGYVLNLSNRPVYLYCGEEDPAKWQGEKMLAAAKAAGFEIPQLIGPKTGHKYHPETKKELDTLMDVAVAKGRPKAPERVRVSTPTLKYNKVDWVTVDALQEHWVVSEVTASKVGPAKFEVKTKGVTEFSLSVLAVWPSEGSPEVNVDGQTFNGVTRFEKIGGKWFDPRILDRTVGGLQKRHDLQGPIDDAFMGSFVFVRPTGKSSSPKVEAWVRSELELAIKKWKINFRGEAVVVDDTAVTEEMMKKSNIILWGDAESNKVIAQLAGKIPVKWAGGKVLIGGSSYEAADHAPIMIYPNPLAPNKYVVLNSGYTFRQGSEVTNGLQTPKLPDWAVIDVREVPTAQWPGKVTAAGFYDEGWGVR